MELATKRILHVTLLFAAYESNAASPVETTVRDALSQGFSTAALLSDDQVIKLGIWNFDPNTYLDTEFEELGSETSKTYRDSLTQFSLPWHKQLSNFDGKRNSTLNLVTRLSYLKSQQEVDLFPAEGQPKDDLQEEFYTAGLGLNYSLNLNERWQMGVGGHMSWMHYQNSMDFNSVLSQVVQPYLDELITNLDIDVLMIEPTLRLQYAVDTERYQWQVFTQYHYLIGTAIGESNLIHDVKPDAWYTTTGVRLLKPFSLLGQSQNIWWRAARVDLGGDLRGAVGTSHYYEFGLGWLFNTQNKVQYLDNVGIGVDINYGSDLSGGTLILLYNVEF